MPHRFRSNICIKSIKWTQKPLFLGNSPDQKLPREKRVFLAFCRTLFGSLHISKFTVFTLFAHQIELLPASKTSPLIMVSLMTSHTMTLIRTTIMKMTLMISPSWSGFTALVPVVWCQHKCSKYKTIKCASTSVQTIKCALVPVLCQQTGILFSVNT